MTHVIRNVCPRLKRTLYLPEFDYDIQFRDSELRVDATFADCDGASGLGSVQCLATNSKEHRPIGIIDLCGSSCLQHRCAMTEEMQP